MNEPKQKTYTVRVANTVTGQQSFVGTFSLRDAIESMERQAKRSRKFVRFEVWEGAAGKPTNPTEYATEGTQ